MLAKNTRAMDVTLPYSAVAFLSNSGSLTNTLNGTATGSLVVTMRSDWEWPGCANTPM